MFRLTKQIDIRWLTAKESAKKIPNSFHFFSSVTQSMLTEANVRKNVYQKQKEMQI